MKKQASLWVLPTGYQPTPLYRFLQFIDDQKLVFWLLSLSRNSSLFSVCSHTYRTAGHILILGASAVPSTPSETEEDTENPIPPPETVTAYEEEETAHNSQSNSAKSSQPEKAKQRIKSSQTETTQDTDSSQSEKSLHKGFTDVESEDYELTPPSKQQVANQKQSVPSDSCQSCNYYIEAPRDDQVINLNFTHIYGFDVHFLETLNKPSGHNQDQTLKSSSKRIPTSFLLPPRGETSSSSFDESKTPSHISLRPDLDLTPPPKVQAPPTDLLAPPSSVQSCQPQLSIIEVISSGAERLLDVICFTNANTETPRFYQSHSRLVKLTLVWPPGSSTGFGLNVNYTKRGGKYYKFKYCSGSAAEIGFFLAWHGDG